MNGNIHCTYVSEKISKIRWRPSTLNEPNNFLTASWDNYENNIRLCEIRPRFMQQELGYDDEEEINPVDIRNVSFECDITEMKFINSDIFVFSTSNGDIYVFKITTKDGYEIDMCQEMCWERIHNSNFGYKCACTSFALYDSDIASVGEDGRIHLLSVNSKTPTASIDKAESCSIECVEFLRYNQLLTANHHGCLKIFDLRSNTNKAEQAFLISNEGNVTPSSLAYHPTQRHIVMAGDEYGSITVWDLREHTHPLNVMRQHRDAVTEITFHPDRPDQFFSCGGGDVFQWTGVDKSHMPGINNNILWYLRTDEQSKHEVYRLMPELHLPVKSIDLSRDKMLCGADNEAMYLIENVNVYNLYNYNSSRTSTS